MKRNVEAKAASRGKPPAVTAARVKPYDYEGLSYADLGKQLQGIQKTPARKR
jgi:hypothetical protein